MTPPTTNSDTTLARHPRLASGCGYAFAVVWLLVWTAGTVYLDLLVVAGAVRGTVGEFFAVLLFSIPFNAVFLGSFILLGVRLFLSERSRLLFGLGIRITDNGGEVRIPLPRVTPPWVAFFTAFLAPMIVLFLPCLLVPGIEILVPGLPWDPPVAVVATQLAVVVACIAGAYVIPARKIASGRVDLVIDRLRDTVTLPQTFGRQEPIRLRSADLVGIRVAAAERRHTEGTLRICTVLVDWRDPDVGLHTAKLLEVNIPAAAEAIADLIRTQLSRQHGARCGESFAALTRR